MAALGARLVVHNGVLVAGDESRSRYQLLVFPAADVSWDGHTLTAQLPATTMETSSRPQAG